MNQKDFMENSFDYILKMEILINTAYENKWESS